MSELKKSATDLIVEAMERADEMAEVVVIYRLKDNNGADVDGFGWVSNTEDTFVRLGMLDSAKWGMLQKSYSKDDPE
jgi:hypothetical protein